MNILNFPDWEILRIEETPSKHVIYAKPTVAPACPGCNENANFYRFGTKNQQYLDLPTLGKQTTIWTERQRYQCKGCSKVFWPVLPEMDEHRGMTRRLVGYIQAHGFKKTFTSIAEETGISISLARKIFVDYVSQLEKKFKVEFPRRLGLDEIYLQRKSRCVLTNLEERTIIEILKGRDKETVSAFLAKIKVGERRKVEVVAIDMWRPYRDLAAEYFAGATVVIDKFHVVRMANDALDEIRKTIKEGLTSAQRRSLKRDRYILLKRRSELNMTDVIFLETWLTTFPDLALAYRLKEEFYKIYTAQSKEAALQRLKKWKAQIPTDPKNVVAQAFKPLVTALANWQTEIFNYFDQRVTNSVTESLNGLIRHVHRNGRGYSLEVLRAKMLFAEEVRVKKTAQPWPKLPDQTLERRLPDDVMFSYLGLMTEPVPQQLELDFGASISTLTEKFQKGEI